MNDSLLLFGIRKLGLDIVEIPILLNELVFYNSCIQFLDESFKSERLSFLINLCLEIKNKLQFLDT